MARYNDDREKEDLRLVSVDRAIEFNSAVVRAGGVSLDGQQLIGIAKTIESYVKTGA